MFPSQPRSLRIVLAGGSGLLGHLLAGHMQEQGHRVTVLTRSPYTAPWLTVHWDGRSHGPWVETLDGADACLDLTGSAPWRRLTVERRGQLLDERLTTTHLLAATLRNLVYPPKLWMQVASLDAYPPHPSRAMDESDSGQPPWRPSWRFAWQLARDNEASFFAAQLERTRQLALRTAPVCAPMPGSLFGRLSRLVRAGFGGSYGSGGRFVSWIHELDFARAVEFLLDRSDLEGVFNLTAPEPVRNRRLMAALRDSWDVPNGLPIPRPLVELAALARGPEAALPLRGRRILPTRLLRAGFEFRFPQWPEAANELTARYRLRE